MSAIPKDKIDNNTYSELQLLVVVPNEINNSTSSRLYVDELYKTEFTLYFFEKEMQVVLPIKADASFARNYFASPYDLCTGIHSTLIRVLRAFQTELVSISIYEKEEGIYYCYLNIKENGKVLSINCNLFDALIISKAFTSKILINKEILNYEGIKVTKELLIEAINSEEYSL